MAGKRAPQTVRHSDRPVQLLLLFLWALVLFCADGASHHWPLAVGVAAFPSTAGGKTYRDLDICSHWNGRRHFLELGDRGELHARNVTVAATNNAFRGAATPFFGAGQAVGNGKNHSSPPGGSGTGGNGAVWYQQCNLELVTCAECVVRITFSYVNFSRTCTALTGTAGGSSTASVAATSGGWLPSPSLSCPCDYVQFSEPPYDAALSGHDFCGDGKVFRSRSRTLLLKFFYRAASAHVFSLQYFSERNVKIISGSPHQTILSHAKKSAVPSLSSLPSATPAHIISTPYFPMPYPRDYGVEHVLTCEAENCHVRLEFTDFQLGLTSSLEVFDSNGQMLDAYSGEHFRPPIFTSSGKSLLLQFRGHGATGVGFRAEVHFVSSKQLNDEHWPTSTDCGGMVSGPGGAITMMDMIANSTEDGMADNDGALLRYDCIWLIKPSNNYMMMKTHISLQVADFHGLAARSELEVRQGTTSSGQLVELLTWPPTTTSTTTSKAMSDNSLNAGGGSGSPQSHIAPILAGFYVRLRGLFGRPSKLAIVYSVFNYMNCYIGSEFLCGNKHCISIRLHCDGFDHCGDGSDEPPSCEADWAHLHQDRRWYSHKPNYYFPKTEEPYPDLKTATGIFIVSTIGIFSVLTAWMVILYRMGVRARQQRQLQNQLQTISEFLEERQDDLVGGGGGGGGGGVGGGPDEPPGYEAPPDYDEVIKVGMEEALRAGRQHPGRRGGGHHQRTQRHQARQQQQQQEQAARAQRPSCCHNRPTTLTVAMPIHGGGEDGGERASTSAEAALDGAPPQSDLAQRVLWATAACGSSAAAAATAPATTTHRTIGGSSTTACERHRRSGSGGALTTSRTSQPDEERSEGFRDDSLNISFSLAGGGASPPAAASSAATSCGAPSPADETPPSDGSQVTSALSLATTTTTTPTPTTTPNGSGSEAATLFRRSWLVMRPDVAAAAFGGHGFVAGVEAAHTYRMQRLRHTFSSPDSFAGLVGLAGGGNAAKQRAVNWREDVACPVHRCNCSQLAAAPPMTAAVLIHAPMQREAIGSHHIESAGSGLTNGQLVSPEAPEAPDSDAEQGNSSSSCFGGVNKTPFLTGGKLLFRHARSKSLTNTNTRAAAAAVDASQSSETVGGHLQLPSPSSGRDRSGGGSRPSAGRGDNRTMKRSSSADLLLLCSSSTPTPRGSPKQCRHEMTPSPPPPVEVQEHDESDESSSKDCIFLI